MNDYTRRRRIATVVAAVALIVMLVLVGLVLRFETRDERPGAATDAPLRLATAGGVGYDGPSRIQRAEPST